MCPRCWARNWAVQSSRVISLYGSGVSQQRDIRTWRQIRFRLNRRGRKPRRLLTGWARTNGRRAQKASWESLHFWRVTAVEPQRWWRAQPSSKHRKQSGGPLDGKGHRFLARLIVVGKLVKTTPRFSGLVEARVWSQCLRASRRRAFSDSRPAATQACPRCAFQSIAQSAGRRR